MDESVKNIYEITFYTKVENAAPVATALAAHRGEVVEEGSFEKVRLEFPIVKETFVFMKSLRVALPPEEVAPITATLARAADVLRFLVTASPASKEASGEPRKMGERRRPPAPRLPREESVTLTNEELEKKIEEILQ